MSFHRVCCCNVGQWLPFSTGMNAQVSALAVYGGNLYAGGSFSTAGGTSAASIAMWNGSAWSALGAGTNGVVNALAVYGGELIVGGNFSAAGGSAAANIAKWNGSSWSTLGSGTNDQVIALRVFGGVLYAGGVFTSAGGSAANFLASWNGSTWSDAGTGVSAIPVNAFTEHSSTLYLGAGSAGASVQSFGGGTWSDVGTSPSNGVFSVASFGGDLYAGGNFTDINSVSVNRLAKYDGSWSAVGGANDTVQALHNWNSQLVVAGEFTNIATRVALYNGSTFSAFGDGLNNPVLALTTYNGYLVAGGQFTASGAATRNRIAYWSIPESP